MTVNVFLFSLVVSTRSDLEEIAWNSVLPTSARASVTAGNALEWKTGDQFHCQFELLNQDVYFSVVLSYLAGSRTFRKFLSTTVCDDAN